MTTAETESDRPAPSRPASKALRARVLTEVLGRMSGNDAGGDSATEQLGAATIRSTLAEILADMQPVPPMPEPETTPPACETGDVRTCTMACPEHGNPEPAPASPRPMVGVGMPAALHLEAFGREINDAFGHLPYLVGSAATSKTWRDVDVRLMLPDDEFNALFPEHVAPARHDGKWGLMCAAISELARVRTGLPVDFQIQRVSRANERYDGMRVPLGIHDRNGQ